MEPKEKTCKTCGYNLYEPGTEPTGAGPCIRPNPNAEACKKKEVFTKWIPRHEKIVRVFHLSEPTFHENPDKVYCVTPAELVAEVKTTDLEEAYMLTNHIDSEWWSHPNVRLIKKSRSTSVGDFMERDGSWYMVAVAGFKKVAGVKK